MRRLSLLAALAAICVLTPPASARVLRVGSFHGIRGQFGTIQAAIDAAKPGDWILVGPGDYHERADHRGNPGPEPLSAIAAVVISTPDLHLRGMNRNLVVIDGTKPGSRECSSKRADQDFGIPDSNGTPLGRNGILVWKANDVWIENLTVCNFLQGGNGEGHTGNGIWWDGGHGSGLIGIHGYWGNYLNATSTFFGGNETAAQYGLFTSDTVGGGFNWSYASNMSDSNYYIGACELVCDQYINHSWSQYGALGYSGTNAGGSIVIENSEFDHNKDGFDTNSQDNDDAISPQDGACPNNGISPITHTHSCWVFINNYVHDNNNPNVPGFGVAAAGPVGTGLSISGGRDDTIMDNRFVNNGAWGIIFVPYPDTETPTPPEACQGGIYSGPPSYLCLFDDWGNAIIHNTFIHNGFFGNDTNGDFAELTMTAGPSNCFRNNIDAYGHVTSSPAGLEQSKPNCGNTAAPDPNPSFLNQVLCDSQFASSIVSGLTTPCTPGARYPRGTSAIMHPLPTTSLKSMPHPCAGVPANPWCPARRKHKHKRRHGHARPARPRSTSSLEMVLRAEAVRLVADLG
jgi:hypothetical protein